MKVVPIGASRLASIASGFIEGCLIFQLPAICSTTSLESIRTSISASGACSAASSRPAISPRYSATLLVAVPIVSPISAITSPVSASLSRAPYAAGPGLPREPPSASTMTDRVHHSPDSPVRTRIRLHSSQRITSSLGCFAMMPRSEAFRVSRQPPHSRRRSAAAPTPPFCARSFS